MRSYIKLFAKTGVYRILNTITGREYIGAGKNIKERWKDHRGRLNRGVHKNHHLLNDWETYGSNTFSFDVLEYCEVEDLRIREEWWVNILETRDLSKGYNINSPLYGSLGRKHSPESITNMIAGRGENVYDIGQYWKGRTMPAEILEKKSAAQKGNKNSFYGKKHSEEALAKMRAAKLGKPSNRRGTVTSLETRTKMSESRKRWLRNNRPELYEEL